MTPPEFKVVSHLNGAAMVLELHGHLNILTIGELERCVSDYITSGNRRLVLDCSALEYCSSAGLRVFLTMVKRLKSSGGSCAFVALTPTVSDIFEIAGFHEVMEIHATIKQAIG
jgi:anti-anti-sigma factor